MASDLDIQEIEKRIKIAWILGIVSLVLTVVLVGAFGDALGIRNDYLWFDCLLMAGLIFGTYRKSRVAATGLFLYFAISKLLQWQENGKPSGIVTAILFGAAFFRGMLATFDYCRWAKLEGAIPALAAVPAATGLDLGRCPKCSADAAPQDRRCMKCGAALVRR